ncbi:MAG: DegV family protein [Eubacterium sp.]|nr:DegV family protein [Eubacterium sp.]
MKQLFRKAYKFLTNSDVDTDKRMFALLSGIGLVGLLLAALSGIIIGETFESIMACAIAFFVFLALVCVAFIFDKVTLVSYIAAFILVCIFLPLNFFTSGGIHGGATVWNVFDSVFIAMMLKGKGRVIMFGIEGISVGVTYYLYWTYPDMALYRPFETQFQDSLFSFLLAGVVIIIMIAFQTGLLRKENEKAKRQKDEIDELNKAQNRFFSSMSHEIRTPINTIIGLNEMILREDASEEINEDATAIQSASKMLLHLINDIMDMSKVHSGQMKLTPVTYVTSDMIIDIVDMIWVRTNEKNLGFSVDISPSLPDELMGDEVRIKQILINVLNNAVKYTNEGQISLSIHHEMMDEKMVNVVYTISDTGMGIRKESIPVLFDAFKRVDEEKNLMIEGTGLGLSIVKSLVDLMGGKISVDSVYTKGSTFTIEIPQRWVGDHTVGELDLNKRSGKNAMADYHVTFEAPKARVLVVDDTTTNLLVVKKLLRDTKIEVTCVESGEEALNKTLEKEYHVILMDHKMPEMDGIEALHKIRNQTGGYCKNSKVIALTANAGSEMAALYYREGFDGYLVKPINGAMLEEEIRSHLPSELVTMTDEKKDIESKSNLWRDEHRTKAMVAITTDSVGAIPPDIAKEYGISVIPVTIVTQDGEFRDEIDINSDGLLRYYTKPDRSAFVRPIETEQFESFFADKLRDARNVIHISATGMVENSSYLAAVEAAKNFDNVYVVDSEHLSGAMGLLVMDAARMAQQGVEPYTILENLETNKQRIVGGFMVESLDYLAASGQIKRGMANLARAFSIHAVVYVSRGRMRFRHLVFGSKRYAWKKMIKKSIKKTSHIDGKVVVVPFVGLRLNEREWLEKEIRNRVDIEKVYFVNTSAVVAANCGPGTFGIAFRKKAQESENA